MFKKTIPTVADIINETEKDKAVKVIKKQLLLSAASLVAITAAAIAITKMLDADKED